MPPRTQYKPKERELIRYFEDFFRDISQEIMKKSSISKIKTCIITGIESTKKNRLVRHHLQSFTLIMLETFETVEKQGYDCYSFIETQIKSIWLEEVMTGEYKKSRTKKMKTLCEEHRDLLHLTVETFTKIHNKYPVVKIATKLHKAYHKQYVTRTCTIDTFCSFFNITKKQIKEYLKG